MSLLSDSEQDTLRRWVAVGVRVLALELGDAADADPPPTDAADTVRGPSPHVGATVVEVLPEGVRVLADDDTTGVLRYDRDDFGLIIGHNQDELPHGYRMHWSTHPWVSGCPRCWAAARVAADMAHRRGEEEGEFADPGGHAAAVHLDS